MTRTRGARLALDSRAKRVLTLVLLVCVVAALYVWGQTRPRLVDPAVRIPLSSEAEAAVKKDRDLAAAVDVVQRAYYNAWLSEYALRNGGWKNVLPLLTDALADRVRKDEAYQDAIAVGSLAGTVRRITLVEEDSSIDGAEIGKTGKDKGVAYVLVTVKLAVDQETADDYYLVQQAVVRLTKVGGAWKVADFGVFKTDQQPAKLVD